MKHIDPFEAIIGFSLAIIFGLLGIISLIVSVLSLFNNMRVIMCLVAFRWDLLIFGLFTLFMSYVLFDDLLKIK